MAQEVSLTLDSIVRQAEGQVSSEIDGEVVLMDIKQGNYYGMNPVLSRIWKLIGSEQVQVSELCRKLTEEYEVSAEECAHDVLESLEKLRREHLIETN